MDGLRRPVGDEEPRVYWVRRAVVLVAIAVLIAVIWLVIRGLTSGGDDADAGTTPDTTSSPTVTQSAGAQTVDNDPSRPCTAEDVQVTSVASPTQVNVGSMPAFEVSVEHVGGAACKLSTTSDGTAMVIRSGDDKYYDSTWCPDTPLFADAEWILQPGDREAVQATWTGQRYSESCEAQGEAAAGYYLSAISIGGIAAAEAQFQMVG